MVISSSISIFIIEKIINNGIYTRAYYFDREPTNDINLVSKLIDSIGKLAGDSVGCINSYAEHEYILSSNYICYSDEDIPYFVKKISSGICDRYSLRVKQDGVNRILEISYFNLNKVVHIYLYNLDDKQLISFKPLNRASVLGFKSSDKDDEYRMNINNPISKYEMRNRVIMLVAIALIPYIEFGYLDYFEDAIVMVSVILVGLYVYNLMRIKSISSFKKDFVENVGVESKYKDELINKIYEHIIYKYKLDSYREYLDGLFKSNKIIYLDNVIYCRTIDELNELIAECLRDEKEVYRLYHIFGKNGEVSVGIEYESLGFNIVIHIEKLENGQVLKII